MSSSRAMLEREKRDCEVITMLLGGNNYAFAG